MEEKTMMPINNQIEPDFLEHIKSTFKRWRDLNTQGVTIGARELSNFAFTLKGASMNSHLGFKYNFNPRGTDADGNPAIKQITNSAITWGRKQSGRNRKRGNTT